MLVTFVWLTGIESMAGEGTDKFKIPEWVS